MRLITHKSKKLFYKKYLYRISFNFAVGSIFRSYWQRTKDLDYVLKRLNEFEEALNKKSKRSSKSKTYIEEGHYYKTRISYEEVDDARNLRECLLNIKEYMVRQEWGQQMMIYVNDHQSLIDALKNFKTIDWVEVHEPDPAILNNQEPDILVSPQAADYAYKLTISIGRARKKDSVLINFITNNRDKIKITDYSLESGYSDAGAYVRDDKVLMLLQMTGNEYIKRIERLILPS